MCSKEFQTFTVLKLQWNYAAIFSTADKKKAVSNDTAGTAFPTDTVDKQHSGQRREDGSLIVQGVKHEAGLFCRIQKYLHTFFVVSVIDVKSIFNFRSDG